MTGVEARRARQVRAGGEGKTKNKERSPQNVGNRRRASYQHDKPVKAHGHAAGRWHMGQGGREIFVQRITLAVSPLLLVHLGGKTGALFDGVGQFAKTVRQLHAAGIKLKPFRQPRIFGLGPRQRRLDARIVDQQGRPAKAQARLDPCRQHFGKDVRPVVLAGDG